MASEASVDVTIHGVRGFNADRRSETLSIRASLAKPGAPSSVRDKRGVRIPSAIGQGSRSAAALSPPVAFHFGLGAAGPSDAAGFAGHRVELSVACAARGAGGSFGSVLGSLGIGGSGGPTRHIGAWSAALDDEARAPASQRRWVRLLSASGDDAGEAEVTTVVKCAGTAVDELFGDDAFSLGSGSPRSSPRKDDVAAGKAGVPTKDRNPAAGANVPDASRASAQSSASVATALPRASATAGPDSKGSPADAAAKGKASGGAVSPAAGPSEASIERLRARARREPPLKPASFQEALLEAKAVPHGTLLAALRKPVVAAVRAKGLSLRDKIVEEDAAAMARHVWDQLTQSSDAPARPPARFAAGDRVTVKFGLASKKGTVVALVSSAPASAAASRGTTSNEYKVKTDSGDFLEPVDESKLTLASPKAHRKPDKAANLQGSADSAASPRPGSSSTKAAQEDELERLLGNLPSPSPDQPGQRKDAEPSAATPGQRAASERGFAVGDRVSIPARSSGAGRTLGTVTGVFASGGLVEVRPDPGQPDVLSRRVSRRHVRREPGSPEGARSAAAVWAAVGQGRG
ncbi:hypothetical protein FNF27_07784 [Cafeteria roenbergensis]|uniref:Uncharacterized protein n=1 Tax=Cafeteria roenbergensis TaxID=33653 RepID=A0A5A8DHI2_CAFRO|nr:hypothetical protein FNF27_07784 [Cafeteria roenbergensis]